MPKSIIGKKKQTICQGLTGTPLCPLAAMLDHIAIRQNQSGPFFPNSNHKPVVKGWFIGQIRLTLESLGLPQDWYAGHSFRIGAAMTAAFVGIEDSTIQTLGRWQSSAFLQYICIPKEQLALISSCLAGLIEGPITP